MIDLQLDRGTPVPLHYQVYRQLREAIHDGRLKPGDALPPEPTLALRLDIARGTLRQAIDQLVREGLLRRERGRGTFVAGPPANLQINGSYVLTRDPRQRDLPHTFRLLRDATRTPPPRVRDALGLTPRARVIEIERLRLVGGEPAALETIYLPEQRLPGFVPAVLA